VPDLCVAKVVPGRTDEREAVHDQNSLQIITIELSILSSSFTVAPPRIAVVAPPLGLDRCLVGFQWIDQHCEPHSLCLMTLVGFQWIDLHGEHRS